jgi:hypothetical protein
MSVSTKKAVRVSSGGSQATKRRNQTKSSLFKRKKGCTDKLQSDDRPFLGQGVFPPSDCDANEVTVRRKVSRFWKTWARNATLLHEEDQTEIVVGGTSRDAETGGSVEMLSKAKVEHEGGKQDED